MRYSSNFSPVLVSVTAADVAFTPSFHIVLYCIVLYCIVLI
jgi:hypothetical protein